MSDVESKRLPGDYQAEDEINLLDYLLVLAKHWKMLAKVCAIVFVLACGLSLLLPNIYISTVRILPPQEDKGSAAALLGGMGGLASLAGISMGGGSGDLYVGMLKSRTISDALIDKYNLMETYDQEYRLKTYEKLAKYVSFSIGKDDGIIAIKVEDEDPQRAADMANTYVAELKKLNLKLNLASAGRERVFLEERLQIVKLDLKNAEEALEKFQKDNKAIKIDAQASAIIEAISTLKAELASKEVQLGVLLSYQTERHPEVLALHEGVEQIRQQLNKLEKSNLSAGVATDIFISTADVPQLGLQLARLMRDFKVQEVLYELLTKQFELAKIEEAKNTSTIQVIDEAVPADKKSKPKRSLIVILATFMAGFCAVLYAFVREYTVRMPSEDAERWLEIKGYLPAFRTKKHSR